MPRIVPSQVVATVDRVYPWAKQLIPGAIVLEPVHAASVGAIVELASNVPDNLLAQLPANDHASYVAALAACRTALRMWETPSHYGLQFRLGKLAELGGAHPISLIREALSKCPDEASTAIVPALGFLADPGLQAELRLDMSTAESALGNAEFKAASVIAGSVIEALLLWAVKRRSKPDHDAAFTAWELRRSTVGAPAPRKLKPDPVQWDLEEYIEVARGIPLISAETADAASLAKSFRNLIHPGRAERLNQRATRSSATLAVGAMHRVAEELEGRVKSGTL